MPRRSRTGGVPLDLARPTIVFAGESILLGYGLQEPETIPARVRALTGLQTANISVNAQATDQSLLRLQAELPRFRRPVAMVIPFVPMLFDRNLDRDRPHLDAALAWHEAEPPPLRLVELARRLLRYRSEAAIEEAVATTRSVLRAVVALARSRGALPIILIPQLQPEDPTERVIRTHVLDEAHIPICWSRSMPAGGCGWIGIPMAGGRGDRAGPRGQAAIWWQFLRD